MTQRLENDNMLPIKLNTQRYVARKGTPGATFKPTFIAKHTLISKGL